MNRKTSGALAALNHHLHGDPAQLMKFEYAAAVIRNEGIKFILLILFYAFVGRLPLFLFSAALLIPVRTFSGGLHLSSGVRCFWFSFTFFLLAVCMLPSLPLPLTVYFTLLFSSILMIAICAPVASENKPIRTKKKYRRCKMISCAAGTFSGSVLLLLCSSHPMFFRSGVWILVLQALQLALAYIIRMRKEATPDEKIHA